MHELPVGRQPEGGASQGKVPPGVARSQGMGNPECVMTAEP